MCCMALIRFYKPALYRKDMDAVLQTMVDEKIGPGERKKEFLKAFSLFLGKDDGVALRSYPDAIMASLAAADVHEDDSVIISVLSPKIYLEVFRRLGVKAVIVDTDEYGIIDPEDAARHMEEAKAVLSFEPVCQMPQSYDQIRALGLPVIVDVSESLGSKFESDDGSFITAGSGGDIVITSFEEDGVISTGGGAAAVSSDPEYVERLKKYSSLLAPYTDLPDMNAALGIVQLSKIDTLLTRRFEIYRMYQQAQLKSDAKLFGSASPLFTANGFGFSVIVNTRPDDAIAFASKYSVSCRRTFTGSVGYRYQDKYDRFPHAIAAITRAVSFPLYPFLSKSDLESVQRVISHIS